jgi:GTP cyclohydrolase II
VEPVVDRIVRARLPTAFGELTVSGYRGRRSAGEYLAFATDGRGESEGVRSAVHLHRRCTLAEVFGGTPCGCGEQLQGVIEDLPNVAPAVVVHFGEGSSEPCGAVRGPEPETPAGWMEAAEIGGILRDLGIGKLALSSNMALPEGIWGDLGFDVALARERRRGRALLARVRVAAGA